MLTYSVWGPSPLACGQSCYGKSGALCVWLVEGMLLGAWEMVSSSTPSLTFEKPDGGSQGIKEFFSLIQLHLEFFFGILLKGVSQERDWQPFFCCGET